MQNIALAKHRIYFLLNEWKAPKNEKALPLKSNLQDFDLNRVKTVQNKDKRWEIQAQKYMKRKYVKYIKIRVKYIKISQINKNKIKEFF